MHTSPGRDVHSQGITHDYTEPALGLPGRLAACPRRGLGRRRGPYIGSSTIGQSILQSAGARRAFEAKSGLKFAALEIPGSGKGIEALLAGKANVAGASRPLKSEEKAKGLVGAVIGYDAVAVFVNVDNPVEKLTKAQLKGIFTGTIKNWKELGGKDAPIDVNTEIQGAKRAGWHSPDYLAKARAIDAALAPLLDEVEARGSYLLVVTSDHAGHGPELGTGHPEDGRRPVLLRSDVPGLLQGRGPPPGITGLMPLVGAAMGASAG